MWVEKMDSLKIGERILFSIFLVICFVHGFIMFVTSLICLAYRKGYKAILFLQKSYYPFSIFGSTDEIFVCFRKNFDLSGGFDFGGRRRCFW